MRPLLPPSDKKEEVPGKKKTKGERRKGKGERGKEILG